MSSEHDGRTLKYAVAQEMNIMCTYLTVSINNSKGKSINITILIFTSCCKINESQGKLLIIDQTWPNCGLRTNKHAEQKEKTAFSVGYVLRNYKREQKGVRRSTAEYNGERK